MAEKTVEELQKELAAAKAETAALAAEKSALENSLEAASETGIVSPKVSGKSTVTVEDPDGNKLKKTIGFKDGRVNTRLRNGLVVPSAGLLKVANGQKLTEKEEENPMLKALTKQEAQDHLVYLISVDASIIEARK